MKKRRTKKSRTVVASAISDKLEKPNRKSELAPAVPPKNREAAAAKPQGGKVWKWARRVVLGYDRNP
jgi:hypothetical protein